MWIYGIFIAGILSLLWFSRKEKISSDKVKRMKCLYRCAKYLKRKLPAAQYLDNKEMVSILIVLLAGVMVGMLVSLSEYVSGKKQVRVLQKGSYEELEYQEKMKVQEEGGEWYIVDIQVPSRSYSQAKIDSMFQSAHSYMEIYILGRNESLDHINYDMSLPTQIPDTPLQVSWVSDSPKVMDWEGKLGSQIPEEGAVVKLTADLTYLERIEQYVITVKVFPPILSKAENRKQEILDEVAQRNSDGKDSSFYLPEEIKGKQLKWMRVRSSNGFVIAFFTLLAAVILVAGKKREKDQKKEERQSQMMLDYPDILSKLILLLSAGMSMRKAFAKIALDYKKQRQYAQTANSRYAYEELLTTYYEMERGVLEQEAYENMGKRCELAAYKTFSVLLVQNLRKGSSSMLEMMEREAETAFEDRKRRARVLGEKAATKLLFPMVGMLLIVFAVLLVPAFLSF